MGTSLEDVLKNNLQGALINTVAAKGANAIGDGVKAGDLDNTSKAIAHALLGCAVGTANAGSSSGCAPGATGAMIGEIVAGLYADASGYDQLKIDANKPGASAELKQQLAVVTHIMTELAKLTGAGGALLIGGDASTMQTAMGTAQNAAVNNRQLHADERAWAESNASKFRDYYQAETDQTITIEQAQQMLLSAEYAVTDDAARNTGRSDTLAARFVSENAPSNLLNTTASERANPLLGGNPDGSWTPEQQARFGAPDVSAWSSKQVQKAEQVLRQQGTCGTDVGCGASKVAAVGNAFTALEQQKALYQDNPARVQQIEGEQLGLVSQLSQHDLEQVQLAAADMEFMLNMSAIGALPAALKGTASLFQSMGVGSGKVVLPLSTSTKVAENVSLGANGGAVPSGFANANEFANFGGNVRGGLKSAGYPDVEPILQGSAVTGKSFGTGAPFDVGRVSDFDVALASPSLLQRAQDLGIGVRSGGTRTGPLSARDLEALGLTKFASEISTQAGREVNFMIYQSPAVAVQRAPSISLPGGK
jgi:hypothetical protein